MCNLNLHLSYKRHDLIMFVMISVAVSSQTNQRKAIVTSFSSGAPKLNTETPWWDIQVGDILEIHNKQPLPADLVVLFTSEDEGLAYIETR